MKNKLLFLTLSFFAVLVSCEKDNNNDVKPDTSVTVKQKLTGNWQLAKAVSYGYDKDGKLTKTEEIKAEVVQVFEFKADGTVKSTADSRERNYQFNLTDANSKVYLNLISTSTDTYEIVINNNVMTWAVEGEVSGNPDYVRARIVYSFDRK